MSERLTIEAVETRPLAIPYVVKRVISRGTAMTADMIEVSLRSGGAVGRGECHETARYHQSNATILVSIAQVRSALLDRVMNREDLLTLMPAGPARNAIDCALWDLEAKLTGHSAEARAGLEPVKPVSTVYTISLATPDEMGREAQAQRDWPMLKIKLGHFADDSARLKAVRRNAPNARLVVDANEGWTLDQLRSIAPVARDLGVELIEQPLPADDDGALEGYVSPVALCADESCHTRASLEEVSRRYQTINIKLDKTGGLTEALALAGAARAKGLRLMVGCMAGTTLAMAPGYLVAQLCSHIDLDSPIYLPPEEQPQITYDASQLAWSSTRTWGVPAYST